MDRGREYKQYNPEVEPKLPETEQRLGWRIEYVSDSNRKAIAANPTLRMVTVNVDKYHSRDAARFHGTIEAARAYGLGNTVREVSVEELSSLMLEHPSIVSDLCLFEGLGFLQRNESVSALPLTDQFPLADSYEAEFRNACAWCVLTGAFPAVSEKVNEQLTTLPVSPKTGLHLLTALGSGEKSFEIRKRNYTQYIAPALEKLRAVDRDLKDLASDSFIPSTDTSQLEQLSEDEIFMRIEPFVGGYAPERVYSEVDWASMSMVDPGVASARWKEPTDIVLPKRSLFIGVFDSDALDQPYRIPLQSTAIPITESLTSSYALRRDDYGCYLLERSQSSVKDPQKEKVTVSFEFGLSKDGHEWMMREPTEKEKAIPQEIVQTFSGETRAFLEELSESRITDRACAIRVAKRVQEMLEYVQDSAVGKVYEAAGTNYFAQLERLKKADCDVSNFYGLALLRALGIPCMMAIGYHVKRDKRFSFAALAGSRHAWLYYYDRDIQQWEKIDMTPPSQDEPQGEEEDGSDGEGFGFREEGEGRIEPVETEESDIVRVWSAEELAELVSVLQQTSQSAQEANLFPRGESPASLFEKEYGVPLEQWEIVRAYIDRVDATPIPRDETIERIADSTIGEEWRSIFELLLIAYQLPDARRQQMVRQSQGDDLIDPTSAAIDVLSGVQDPFGYANKRRALRTEHLPINFSNDMLLDLTASMEARDENGTLLKEAQRQFVLSDLFHGFKLNEELSQHEAELGVVPYVTNALYSIHGAGFAEQSRGPERMTIQRIARLYDELNATTKGAGNMLGALRAYRETIFATPDLIRQIKEGEILKTLTIISDGNLWCSMCGKEECTYQLHAGVISQTSALVNELRSIGVFVNAIGFTVLSKPVVEIFKDTNNPRASQVARDVRQAVMLHHGQIAQSLERVRTIARKRLDFLKEG